MNMNGVFIKKSFDGESELLILVNKNEELYNSTGEISTGFPIKNGKLQSNIVDVLETMKAYNLLHWSV